MAANRLPAMAIEMRKYVGRLEGDLHDLTGRRAIDTTIFDPDDYAAAQALAGRLRAADSNGVVYDSVRDPRGAGLRGRVPPAATWAGHAAPPLGLSLGRHAHRAHAARRGSRAVTGAPGIARNRT